MKIIENNPDIEVFEFINSISDKSFNYISLKDFLISKRLPLKDEYLYYLLGKSSHINQKNNQCSLSFFRAQMELKEWKLTLIDYPKQLESFIEKFDKTTLIFINQKIGEELFVLYKWEEASKSADSAIKYLEENDDFFEIYF
jgi:hypothetical protein